MHIIKCTEINTKVDIVEIQISPIDLKNRDRVIR